MVLFKHVLVPYDGSVQSKNALKTALGVAKSSGATLHLLYVIPEIFLPSYSGGQLKKSIRGYEKEIYSDHKERALRMLQAQKKKRDPKVAMRLSTAYGSTASQILNYAKRHGIDLIVIGTVSRRGLARITSLGSVARKVSEASACPVLLVH